MYTNAGSSPKGNLSSIALGGIGVAVGIGVGVGSLPHAIITKSKIQPLTLERSALVFDSWFSSPTSCLAPNGDLGYIYGSRQYIHKTADSSIGKRKFLGDRVFIKQPGRQRPGETALNVRQPFESPYGYCTSPRA